ncbi:MAG: hypothetical protein AUJ49_11675 [Desulfovibrionaceae bacterium CG1_02_65_16]|nr:MAG: hypothetical protein AUJ49_11675 [Desulfovibrionaceae bacterium CG1_02_65_16]
MKRLFLALTLALSLLAGCAAGQVHYGIASLDELKPGVTRERDLVRVFGMPSFTTPANRSSTLWTWQYPPEDEGTHAGIALLSILIDDDGHMVRVTRLLRH